MSWGFPNDFIFFIFGHVASTVSVVLVIVVSRMSLVVNLLEPAGAQVRIYLRG